MGYGLVTAGHPEGLPCSALVAGLLHRLDGRATVAEVIGGLGAGVAPAVARQIEQSAMQALHILYVDGALMRRPG